MKLQVIVMSDFGDAIFWDNEGVNIGGPDGCDDINISESLLNEFADWHLPFERFDFENNPDFNWDEYHKKGMELSRKLKKEVGEDVEIIYEKPFEDPNHHLNERTVIK